MVKPELLSMSEQELSRLEVVQQVIDRRLTQRQAGQRLGLCDRQIRRLLTRYKRTGAAGLVSQRRGRPSHRRFSDELKAQMLKLIQSHYADFGPTLVAEKLDEQHHIQISKETVRQWMIQAQYWRGKLRRPCRAHPQRPRRSALGELVQIDGSPHAWFEDRGPSCCLLVIVDDATSRLLGLRFEPVETTAGYFRLFKSYLTTSGRPLACYHDRHGIFQVNAKEVKHSEGITQFERAMNDLGIESIGKYATGQRTRRAC